jgi:hypothetical protein
MCPEFERTDIDTRQTDHKEQPKNHMQAAIRESQNRLLPSLQAPETSSADTRSTRTQHVRKEQSLTTSALASASLHLAMQDHVNPCPYAAHMQIHGSANLLLQCRPGAPRQVRPPLTGGAPVAAHGPVSHMTHALARPSCLPALGLSHSPAGAGTT